MTLNSNSVEAICLKSSERGEFPITQGNVYRIYGMCLWENSFYFLVKDDSSMPNWHDVTAFEKKIMRLPKEWLYRSLPEYDVGVRAIWGYRDLVEIPSHRIGLIERETEALLAFFNMSEAENAS